MDSTTPPPGSPGPSSDGPSPYLPPYQGIPQYPGAPPHQGTRPHQGASRPPRGAAFFDSLRRSGLARAQDRWIGGVASGIAAKLGIDPLIVRGAFVVLALFGGAAIVVYGVAWALLPEAADGRIHLEEAIRGRFDAALAGAIAFVLVGMSRPTFWFESGRWLPDWIVAFAWLGLVATVIAVAVLASNSTRRSRAGRPVQGEGTSPPATGPGGPAPFDAEPGGSMSSRTSPAGTMDSGPPTPYPAYEPPATHARTQTGPDSWASGATTPTGAMPAYPVTPPPPAWQPPPKRPRAAGAGAPTVGLVLALALLTGAGVLIGHRLDLLTGSAALTIAGSTLVLLGLGALVSGARGRRAGALGVLGVLIAIVAVPAAVLSSEVPDWRRVVVSGGPFIAGDVLWAPTTIGEAAGGYSYSIGEARIDLTGPAWLTADAAAKPARVLVEAGAGSTTVVLPSGVPLEVRTTLGAGEIRSSLAQGWTRTVGGTTVAGSPGSSADGAATRVEASGTDLDVVLRSPGEGDLALIVTIDAALGDVIIEEDLT